MWIPVLYVWIYFEVYVFLPRQYFHKIGDVNHFLKYFTIFEEVFTMYEVC